MKFIDFPKINISVQGMDEVRIPKMVHVRQLYDDARIEDIPEHIRKQMDTLKNKEQYRGKRLCITAGSRGIPDLDVIILAVIECLKSWGAQPFIVPAMGSHGGATAQGQLDMLAGYNITEESMGVPIESSMDVERIGTLPDGTPVFCDRIAFQSDGIIIMNKVKPHTDFRAAHESGLAKMMAIGLGDHVGASQFHMKGFSTFKDRIPQVCGVFLENAPIAFGVGIVQNAYDKISRIDVCEKNDILKLDAQLLETAKKSIPVFKFHDFDVLMIDEVGKNISGNGFDPNIVGRSSSPGFSDILSFQKLFVRGLTQESHHNACGMGHWDVTTRRCLNDIDFEATWTNIITSTVISGGRIPIYMENDRDALRLAIRTCNAIAFDRVKLAHIKNTLKMSEIDVSVSLYEEIKENPEIEVLSEPFEIEFDSDGFLI